MVLKYAPPGTKRFRGRIRAQMAKCAEMLNSINDYNAKLNLRVPPMGFLQPDQVTAILNMRNQMFAFIEFVNPNPPGPPPPP